MFCCDCWHPPRGSANITREIRTNLASRPSLLLSSLLPPSPTSFSKLDSQLVAGVSAFGALRLYLFFVGLGCGGSLFGVAGARPCLLLSPCVVLGSPPGSALGVPCCCPKVTVIAGFESRCLGHIGSRCCDKDLDVSSDCYCILCSSKNRPEPTARLRPAA